MRYITKLLAVICCLCAVTTVFAGGATAKKDAVSVLYVLTARAGVIAKAGKDGYTLTLNDVSPQVLWFTDRPNRKAGMLPTRGFIGHWLKPYKGDAPNVGLVHAGVVNNSGGVATPMAMELSKPIVKGSSVRFQVKMLGGDSIKLGKLQAPSIFIDDSRQ